MTDAIEMTSEERAEAVEVAMSILRSGMGYLDAVNATGLAFDDVKAEWDARVLRAGSRPDAVHPFAELEVADPRDPQVLADLAAMHAALSTAET